jgi:hypothetical protein
MKPLNQKERMKAYQKVVGLFILSFALAMVLGFTTMNVNKLTETKTKADLEKLQEQQKFQRDVFAPNIEEATKILVKVPVYRQEGENIEVLNSNIASLLSQTKNQVKDDGGWESGMYLNVLKVYSDLQLSYREQLRLEDELGGSRSNTQGSDRDLQRCLDERRNLQSELTVIRADNRDLESRMRNSQKELDDCNQINKVLRDENTRLRRR